MLQQIGSQLLKQRLMMWMLGRAQPNAPVLIPFVRVGLLGLAASIAGGLLFTLGCVGLLASLYLYVESLGLKPALSLLIVSGVTFLLAGFIFFSVQRIFKQRASSIAASLQATQAASMPIDDAVVEIPRAILTGFIEGILGDRGPRSTHTN